MFVRPAPNEKQPSGSTSETFYARLEFEPHYVRGERLIIIKAEDADQLDDIEGED